MKKAEHKKTVAAKSLKPKKAAVKHTKEGMTGGAAPIKPKKAHREW